MKAGKKSLAKRRARIKACAEYLQDFESEHGSAFCESRNHEGEQLFISVHHIMRAARYANHKSFNDKKNMMLVCQKCHNALDQYKRKAEHEELVKERGLSKLFTRKRA